MTLIKKRDKAAAKLEKKLAKSAAKANKLKGPPQCEQSTLVRYSDIIRGLLAVSTGASLLIALLLGQRGVIVSLDDLAANLFAAVAGKIVLLLIAIGLIIAGLKHVGLIR